MEWVSEGGCNCATSKQRKRRNCSTKAADGSDSLCEGGNAAAVIDEQCVPDSATCRKQILQKNYLKNGLIMKKNTENSIQL